VSMRAILNLTVRRRPVLPAQRRWPIHLPKFRIVAIDETLATRLHSPRGTQVAPGWHLEAGSSDLWQELSGSCSVSVSIATVGKCLPGRRTGRHLNSRRIAAFLSKSGNNAASRRHPRIIKAAAMGGRSHAIAPIKHWYGHLAIRGTTAALALPTGLLVLLPELHIEILCAISSSWHLHL
jgi:hypothetical protein